MLARTAKYNTQLQGSKAGSKHVCLAIASLSNRFVKMPAQDEFPK